jgi:hypothetical protein
VQPVPSPASPSPVVPVIVRLTREPWSPFFSLSVEAGDGAGSTEDLEPDEARDWFKDRGANMVMVEKALDDCWAFYGKRRPIRVRIMNPRRPPSMMDKHSLLPKI